jgi:ADP-ribose pyrophosphatase YjhB (NUDIX family)
MQDQIIDGSWYNRLPNIPEETSAGGIVIRLEGDDVLVALLKEGSHKNQKYVLPKGRLEPGESLEQGARREIHEEAGLSDLHPLADLGMQERLSFSKKRWKRIHYFLFLTRQTTGTPTDPHISYELAWFPIHNLPDMLWPEQKALIDLNRSQIINLTKKFADS